ncbi:MAG: preprotein translocase subunit SecG [Bryobacteraceae bacterium]
MVYLVTTIHVILCLFLIIVVLLQSGKAADLAGAFGGMGSQTVFGPRGTATLLSKATAIAATLFMITSIALVVLSNNGSVSTGSVLEHHRAHPAAVQQHAPAPAKPHSAPQK